MFERMWTTLSAWNASWKINEDQEDLHFRIPHFVFSPFFLLFSLPFFFFYKNTNTNFSRSINEMKILLFLFYISRLNGFEVETCLCDTRCNDGVGCGLAYNKHACISLRCSTILQRKTKLFLFFFFFFKRTILFVVIHIINRDGTRLNLFIGKIIYGESLFETRDRRGFHFKRKSLLIILVSHICANI